MSYCRDAVDDVIAMDATGRSRTITRDTLRHPVQLSDAAQFWMGRSYLAQRTIGPLVFYWVNAIGDELTCALSPLARLRQVEVVDRAQAHLPRFLIERISEDP